MRDAHKCWNLERVIQAELMGQEAPEDESFDAFVQNADMLDGKLKARLFLLGVATWSTWFKRGHRRWGLRRTIYVKSLMYTDNLNNFVL